MPWGLPNAHATVPIALPTASCTALPVQPDVYKCACDFRCREFAIAARAGTHLFKPSSNRVKPSPNVLKPSSSLPLTCSAVSVVQALSLTFASRKPAPKRPLPPPAPPPPSSLLSPLLRCCCCCCVIISLSLSSVFFLCGSSSVHIFCGSSHKKYEPQHNNDNNNNTTTTTAASKTHLTGSSSSSSSSSSSWADTTGQKWKRRIAPFVTHEASATRVQRAGASLFFRGRSLSVDILLLLWAGRARPNLTSRIIIIIFDHLEGGGGGGKGGARNARATRWRKL